MQHQTGILRCWIWGMLSSKDFERLFSEVLRLELTRVMASWVITGGVASKVSPLRCWKQHNNLYW